MRTNDFSAPLSFEFMFLRVRLVNQASHATLEKIADTHAIHACLTESVKQANFGGILSSGIAAHIDARMLVVLLRLEL
jgi:hypothetical protein